MAAVIIMVFCFPAAVAPTALSLDTLAKQAISPTDSPAAIEKLRAAGPAGLDALFSVYADRLPKTSRPSTDPDWEKIRAAFDAVAQERDAYASHLYWYT